MNPSDPFVPQPGDWEAALEVIQASEARHDRGVLLRRWAGWGGLVLLLGAVIWMGGARGKCGCPRGGEQGGHGPGHSVAGG